MLASVFVTSGIDVMRNPGPRVAKAEPVAPHLAAKVGLPQDTELLVRINAATQIVAGALLAMGKLRRLSAFALLASLVPTTYAGHRFWEIEDPRERSQQQVHFLKNVAMMGGLLLAVVDTEGRPSVGWRARRAALRSAAAVKAAGAVPEAATARLAKQVSGAAGKAKGASAAAGRATDLAKKAVKGDVLTGVASKATAAISPG